MKRPLLEERRAMHDIIASADKAKAEAQITKMEARSASGPLVLAHMETQK